MKHFTFTKKTEEICFSYYLNLHTGKILKRNLMLLKKAFLIYSPLQIVLGIRNVC